MDWPTLNSTMLSILSEIAIDVPIVGAPAFQAEWDGRSREMVSPDYGHALYLKITTYNVVGEDEQRFEYNDTTKIVTATNGGMRKLNLQVRSECTEDTDTNWCFAVLDRICTRIWRNRYVDRMRDEANAAFIDGGTARQIPVTGDSHLVSAGVLDLTVYAAFNDVDSQPFNWIEKVQLTTHFGSRTDVSDVQVPP